MSSSMRAMGDAGLRWSPESGGIFFCAVVLYIVYDEPRLTAIVAPQRDMLFHT